MPVNYLDSSDDLSPHFPACFIRKVSKSVGTFRVRKHVRFDSKHKFRHSRSRSQPHSVASHSHNLDADAQGSVRGPTSLNIDGSHEGGRLVSSGGIEAGSRSSRGRHESHTLETVLEVPSSATSRRTTTVTDAQSSLEEDADAGSQITPLRRLHVQHSSACSDMHQSVKSGDYLLARGANPRTGVVTPAHSASSSLDDYTTVRVPGRPPRWRQNGDQWISLDMGQPTPMSTTPSERLPEHQYEALRTPQKLAARLREPLPGSSVAKSPDLVNVQQRPGITFQIDPRSVGSDPGHRARVGATRLSDGLPKSRLVTPVKRKPVGSPLGRSTADSGIHALESSGDSTDTVLRKPRLNDELRSSSAPGPLQGNHFNSLTVEKDLPRVPYDPFLDVHKTATADESFLEASGIGHPDNGPVSRTPNVSGRQTAEKELPCLPTSNGRFQSRLNNPPYPTSPENATCQSVQSHRTIQIGAPQGPRGGGNPSFPYIRTARSTYPISQTTKRQQPLGERVMSIPVYDNPPKHPSPLVRATGPRAEGPRFMPQPGMSVPERTRLALYGLSNITTTHTDMSIDQSALPKPLQVGPRPMKPDPRKHRGRHGFLRTTPPRTGSGIIMNTAMTMSHDSMVSIPMPRIRPRAMARPAMPTRAEGMYGIPKIHVGSELDNTAGMKCHQSDHLPATNGFPDLVHPGQETYLTANPLKPLAQPSDGTTTSRGMPEAHRKAKSTNSGLMRQCSRCDHGFVDVELHDIDSVIHTSDLQKDAIKAKEDTRSSLPGLPDAYSTISYEHQQENNNLQALQTTTNDEHDHNICCPECCKLDCHEGCLGHPSPTPSPSSLNTMWSEPPRSGSASGLSTPTGDPRGFREETTQESIPKLYGPGFVTFAPSLLPAKGQESKSGIHIQTALTKPRHVISMQSTTPTSIDPLHIAKRQAGAIAAAASALKPPVPVLKSHGASHAASSAMAAAQRKVSAPRPGMHRRQRSNSTPVIGLSSPRMISGNSESSRALSGTRLRVPSPLEFAISCTSVGKNARNASGASMNTIDLQFPNLASLATGGGYTALAEIIAVPLEATKMWIKTHPQILTLGHEGFHRAWEMAQVMTKTTWRLWAVVFVYSKTGKIKFHGSRGETASGFLVDVARSMLYVLVFAAVSALVLRVLGLVLSVLSVGVWFIRAVFWVVRGILGIGAVK